MEENMLALFWTLLGAVGAGGFLGILPLPFSLSVHILFGRRKKQGRFVREMKDALFFIWISICMILYFYMTMDGRMRIGVGAVLIAFAFLSRRLFRFLDGILTARVIEPMRHLLRRVIGRILSPFVRAFRFIVGHAVARLRKLFLRLGRRYAILTIKKYQKKSRRRTDALIRAFMRGERTFYERRDPIHQ